MDIFVIKKIKELQLGFQLAFMLLILCIILGLEYFLLLWQPIEKLKTTNAGYIKLSQQFHQQSQLIQNQDDISKTLLKLTYELSQVDILKENHLNEIISQLTMHATENHLQNISIKPEVISEGGNIILQMRVIGSYSQFMHFLLSINKISYAINIKDLSLVKDNNSEELDINLQILVSKEI